MGSTTAGASAPRAATTLSFVEAQRAAAVLEDAVEKLVFLRSVEPDVLTHKEELSAAMGDEVERVMRRQSELEERYRVLLDERASLQGVVNKKQRLNAIKVEIAEVDRELKDVTKSLSRALKDNPRVGDNLRKMVGERDQLLELLTGAVDELQSGSSQLGPIEGFVREEQEARQMLEGLKEEEDDLSRNVEVLRKQMLDERERHEKHQSKLDAEIRTIKEQVRISRDRTTAVAKADVDRADASTQARARALALAEAKLRGRLSTVEAARAVEAGAHRQASEQLAAEQATLAARVAAETTRVGIEVAEAEERVAELERRREANRERLATLLARWEEETERERVEAEAQRAREIERRRALADAQRKARAAETLRTIIPDLFDLVRAFAPKKKGKKKGKK
jgi:hypothetical protein